MIHEIKTRNKKKVSYDELAGLPLNLLSLPDLTRVFYYYECVCDVNNAQLILTEISHREQNIIKSSYDKGYSDGYEEGNRYGYNEEYGA